jgi:hypothetical protein
MIRATFPVQDAALCQCLSAGAHATRLRIDQQHQSVCLAIVEGPSVLRSTSCTYFSQLNRSLPANHLAEQNWFHGGFMCNVQPGQVQWGFGNGKMP